MSFVIDKQASPPKSISVSGLNHTDDVVNDSLQTTPKKRRRDSRMDENISLLDLAGQIPKSLRFDKVTQEPQTRDIVAIADHLRDTSPIQAQQSQVDDEFNLSQTDKDTLTSKQKKFLDQWYEDFVQHPSQSTTPHESLIALAILIQARPQLIHEYISNKYSSTTHEPATCPTLKSTSLQPHSSTEPYSLTRANNHLPSATLALVEKFISTCHRRRPPTDGRRTVNSGPFRCSFSCGYRTKRVFDWRRHEETHEPQELWLCALCCQVKGDTQSEGDLYPQNPFLVNRKDKFLRHAKDAHQQWVPETVLEMSRVGYRPRVGGKCEVCGGAWESWDERCKHLLGHFEDEIERGCKREDEWGVDDKCGSLKSECIE